MQRTVVLEQTDKNGLTEGKSLAFSLEIFCGSRRIARQIRQRKGWADTTIKGTVETEDVSFNFESTDRKTTLHHFLDEIDAASFKTGRKTKSTICR